MWLVGIHSVQGNLPYRIGAGEFIVGRTKRAHIVIAEPTISRRHARLDCHGSQVTVEDLGSSNGTFVNEAAVAGAVLSLGDYVRFGSVACALYPTPFPPRGVLESESTYQIPLRRATADTDLTMLFTSAQLRIVPLLMKGFSEPEIASALGRSPHTIHAHIRAIFARAGVHSREELIVKLLEPEPP